MQVRIALLSLLLLGSAQILKAQSYWQQSVSYKIDVTLSPSEKMIRGNYSLTYTNNSPVSLDSIVMHVWPNAYKDHLTPLSEQLARTEGKEWYFAEEEDRGFLDSLYFSDSEGDNIKYEKLDRVGEILSLKLNTPLASGASITISTPMRLKVPKLTSRLGQKEGEFHLCQWFPKPAVFDQKGWNYFPYLNMGEFYSEYGNFEVTINVPQTYVVAGSGKRTLNENNANGYKKLKYELSNAHDFAFFMSEDFLKKSGEVKLEGRADPIIVELYCSPSMEDLSERSLIFSKRAVKFLSEKIGNYPYPVYKVVLSGIGVGGGMEYPSMVVIDEFRDLKLLDEVIAHETAHQWFYGMLGSNERKHAWMDEGITSYYEHRYMDEFYPKSDDDGFSLSSLNDPYLLYSFCAHQGLDHSIALPADSQSVYNIGMGVYQKAALSFKHLEGSIGMNKMDEVIGSYFKDWRYKHPQPEDLRNSLERSSNKKLSWLFDGLIGSNGFLDYKIVKVEKDATSNNLNITIKNTGDINAPFPIASINASNKAEGLQWIEGFYGTKVIQVPATSNTIFKIDPLKQMPEFNRSNNRYNSKALFPKFEKPTIKAFVGLENPDESELYVLPTIGGNAYDGFMLGVGAYNSAVPSKPLEFGLFPMYGFRSNEVVGQGFLRKHFLVRTGAIRKASIGIRARHFNYFLSPKELYLDFDRTDSAKQFKSFYQFVPEVELEFRPKSYVSNKKHTLAIRSYVIGDQQLKFDNVSSHFIGKERFWFSIQEADYNYTKTSNVNSLAANLNLQQGFKNENSSAGIPGNFVRLSGELNAKIDYKGKKSKFLDVRLFAGGFLLRKFDAYRTSIADFRMMSYSGRDDYLYDNIFFGRSETTGFWSQQIAVSDGGFKINTPQRAGGSRGRNNQFMTALNISTSLPSVIPIRVFADAAYYPDYQFLEAKNIFNFDYVAGISLPFGEVAEIYWPFIFSDGLKTELMGFKWYENIRFKIDLKKVNPFKLIREFELQ